MRYKFVCVWACVLLLSTPCFAQNSLSVLARETSPKAKPTATQSLEENLGTITLQMASPYNAMHPVLKNVFLPWIQSMQRQSKGYVIIEVLDANAVLIEADLQASIVSGSLSMGVVLPTSTLPNPPVSTLLNLYLDAPNSYLASSMVWDALQNHQALKDELQLMHVLWAWSSSPAYLHTISRPIHVLKDIQGMKLLVWSKGMETLVATLGGIPILCVPAETGNLLGKGIAEGIICPMPPLNSFGVDAYIRYTTDIPLEYFSFYMGINREIWAGLPGPIKKLFTETTGRDMSLRCGAVLDAVAKQTRIKMQSTGHIFVPLSKEARKEVHKHLVGIRQHESAKVQALQLPNMTDFAPLIHALQQKYADDKDMDKN